MKESPDAHGDLDLLKFYRREIRFESERVGRRLNALLSSQAFLIVAFAAATSASYNHSSQAFSVVLPLVLAALGFVLTMTAWPGICAAADVVERWHGKERDLLERSSELGAYSILSGDEASRKLVRRRHEGTFFAKWVPVIFALAWISFAALIFSLHHGWLAPDPVPSGSEPGTRRLGSTAALSCGALPNPAQMRPGRGWASGEAERARTGRGCRSEA